MTRREILRERAETLWREAESSDLPAVRQELRHLAAVCEDELAELGRIEREQHRVEQLPA